MADDKAKAKAIKDSKKKTDDTDDSGRNRQDQKAKNAEPDEEEPAINPRKFIIINPPIDDINVNEEINHHPRSQTEADYFIRLGLGDQDHLNFYRQAIMNPAKAIQNPNLRKYVTDVTEQLLDIIWGDSQMKNRLRTILQEKYQRQVDIDNHDRGMPRKANEALIGKAQRSGIDVEILREVFVRGMEASGNDQTQAFNRVNSFIAGGKARQMDADLLDGIGSDSVTKRYADMTPGQSFSLIKKALRNKND